MQIMIQKLAAQDRIKFVININLFLNLVNEEILDAKKIFYKLLLLYTSRVMSAIKRLMKKRLLNRVFHKRKPLHYYNDYVYTKNNKITMIR